MINNRIEVVDDLNSHALPLPLLLTTSPPFPPYYFPTYFLLLLSLLLHLLAFALRFLSFCIAFS